MYQQVFIDLPVPEQINKRIAEVETCCLKYVNIEALRHFSPIVVFTPLQSIPLRNEENILGASKINVFEESVNILLELLRFIGLTRKKVSFLEMKTFNFTYKSCNEM